MEITIQSNSFVFVVLTRRLLYFQDDTTENPACVFDILSVFF